MSKKAVTKRSHAKASDMEIAVFVGKRIKMIRIICDVDRKHLAKVIGITSQQLLRYENATSVINIVTLGKIANNLMIDIKSFFSEEILQKSDISTSHIE